MMKKIQINDSGTKKLGHWKNDFKISLFECTCHKMLLIKKQTFTKMKNH